MIQERPVIILFHDFLNYKEENRAFKAPGGKARKMSGNKLLAATFKATWIKWSCAEFKKKKNAANRQTKQRSEAAGESPCCFQGLDPVVFLPLPGLLNLCEPITPLLFSPQVFSHRVSAKNPELPFKNEGTIFAKAKSNGITNNMSNKPTPICVSSPNRKYTTFL